MWHRLLLVSLIQAGLFSQHALARRIKQSKQVIQAEADEDEAGCPPPNPREDAYEANQPANGWLLVICESAMGLKNTNWTGEADPFCQIELQDASSGRMLSKSVGLVREEQVSGNTRDVVRLNEEVAFDLDKFPKALDNLKVKLSVRDDDNAFGNGVGTYNGGDLMGSKTVSLPPRGKESVKFFNHYLAMEDGQTGSWDWCPHHLCPEFEKPGQWVWKPKQNASSLQSIPGAWEVEGSREKFDDGNRGTLSYRIRWCPYTNFDEQETKRWRQVRGKGCVKEKTVYKSRRWVWDYAPACVIQGMRLPGKSAYCFGGPNSAKCSGNTPSVRTVKA